MDNFSVDVYTPKEIAARIEKAGISKSTNDPIRILALAILAGAFIALGAVFYTTVTFDSAGIPAGLMRLLGGLVFSLGLILVVVAGAELFTGNNLIVIAYVDGKVSFYQLMKNWLLVYIGNFIGALGVLLLIYLSNHWSTEGGALGAKAILIANAKVNLTWMEAFSRGVLCNILVCMAVWLCFAGRSVTDKVMAIIFPITAFVTMGFEHSVANMYFIPAGIMAMQQADLVTLIGESVDLTNMTLSGFFVTNLLPVTLGNILGGSVFVALFYWFIYLRH